MRSVFLSYRREDSGGHAGRLHDHFLSRWGEARVFFDIDNIPPGEDFIDAIDRTLDSCTLVLVVVGPRWLDIRDARGNRRIDNGSDFHRLEVERALTRGIKVLPVLVGGAKMPAAEDLPPSLASFSRRNAFDVSDIRFRVDASRLADHVDHFLESALQQELEAARREKARVDADRRIAEENARAVSERTSAADRGQLEDLRRVQERPQREGGQTEVAPRSDIGPIVGQSPAAARLSSASKQSTQAGAGDIAVALGGVSLLVGGFFALLGGFAAFVGATTGTALFWVVIMVIPDRGFYRFLKAVFAVSALIAGVSIYTVLS